jgi:hypothetical protein
MKRSVNTEIPTRSAQGVSLADALLFEIELDCGLWPRTVRMMPTRFSAPKLSRYPAHRGCGVDWLQMCGGSTL